MAIGEVSLRAAALFVGNRSSDWRAGSAVHVLCLGDSHTYGAGVAEHESYPAQLQKMLDERSPDHYSVINLGLPGMSTTQVRNRLAANIARYQPDLVVLWVGSNDSWNHSEIDDVRSGIAVRMDGLAQRSRLYRLVRLAIYNRGFDGSDAGTRADGTHQNSELLAWDNQGRDRSNVWSMEHGGISEIVRIRGDPRDINALARERTYRNFKEMSAWLRVTGIPLVLMGYPSVSASAVAATSAMRQVADEEAVAFIDSAAAIQRVPEQEREWANGGHPGGRMNGEVVADLVHHVESEGTGSD